MKTPAIFTHTTRAAFALFHTPRFSLFYCAAIDAALMLMPRYALLLMLLPLRLRCCFTCSPFSRRLLPYHAIVYRRA